MPRFSEIVRPQAGTTQRERTGLAATRSPKNMSQQAYRAPYMDNNKLTVGSGVPVA